MKITLPIPWKVSTNQIYAGSHWTTRTRHKDIYHRALFPFRKKRVKSYPVKITFTFCFKKNPLDATNCSYMAKMLEDGMKMNGILKDDSPKEVKAIEILVKKGNDEVEISIK